MKLRKILGFSSIFLIITILFIGNTHAQIIFRKDKPEVKLVWSRVADYSPSLRSVETAEISPTGKNIISGSKFGNYLMFWRVADGELLWEKVLDAEIEAVTFSPDGKYVAAGDEAYFVTIWDTNGKLVKKLKHDCAFDGITWSPNGKYVAGGSEKGEVVLWNTPNWKKEKILAAGATVNSLQFTKDNKKLIAAGNKMNPNPTHDWDRHGFVKAWNCDKNWEVIFEIRAQKKSSKSVRFSPDEKNFAVAGFAKQVKVFSFPKGQEIASVNFQEKVEAVEYHPEGNFIFVGGHSDDMKVLNTENYAQVSSFHCKRIEYIHFSQDGRLMVTGHEDSGLLNLYMLISKVQSGEDYRKLSREILENKDLK